MFFCFNQQKKLEEFLKRTEISDEEFLHRVGLSGNSFKQAVQCYRSKLGEVYQIPPAKLYPDDNFRALMRFPTSSWNWDILELIVLLEETLGVAIDEEQVPDWTNQKMTLGRWIAELLKNLGIQL